MSWFVAWRSEAALTTRPPPSPIARTSINATPHPLLRIMASAGLCTGYRVPGPSKRSARTSSGLSGDDYDQVDARDRDDGRGRPDRRRDAGAGGPEHSARHHG